MHSGEKRSRSKRIEIKSCNAKRIRTIKDSRNVNMQCVLAQVPTLLLSFLDAPTQRALRVVFSSISDAQIRSAQRFWGPHYMNDPFHTARNQCLRDVYYKKIVDLRVLIVRSTTPRVNFIQFAADAKNRPGVSLWKTTPSGAVLQYFAVGRVPGEKDKPERASRYEATRHVILHIATLANAARRIVVRTSRHDGDQNSQSHYCHALYDSSILPAVRFDPSRCVTPLHFPTDWNTWITMIIEGGEARLIPELKPLRDMLPTHLH